MADFWLEAFGWAGSVLVVVSLMLANARRFRVLNLIGCIIATIYNAIFMIWPYAAMNAAISAINVYWLIRLRREEKAAQNDEIDPTSDALNQARVR